MTRFTALDAIPAHARGAAVAIGNFDGVHVGHRAVIDATRQTAGASGCSLAVAVFEPHPRRFFKPDAPPFRLQSTAQRARALEAAGVAYVYEVRFDEIVARMTDREFAEQVLVKHIGAAHVCVGAEFRFGRARMAGTGDLARLGAEFGFGVTIVPAVQHGGEKYSSSSIRAALAAGDVKHAASLLGRPWAIEGEVERGFARGRAFGFPTANLALGDYTRPQLGIYAVRVSIGGAKCDGAASVGINPTVGVLPEPVLEAHIFEFDRDLYGQTIEVEFVAFLRDEAKFDDVDALKAQMARDCDAARAELAKA